MNKDTTITKNLCNEPISKCSELTEVSGDIDCLVSYLGVAKANLTEYQDNYTLRIDAVQRLLFILGTECNCSFSQIEKLARRINTSDVDVIKFQIKDIKESVMIPTDFILPGENKTSANFDMCRVYARKLERSVIKLHNQGFINNKYILEWINKLSYYLYLLARSTEVKYNYVKG